MAATEGFLRGSDREGNPIDFNPRTGEVREVAVRPEREAPEAPPRGVAASIVLPPLPGGCVTTIEDVRGWYLEYLHRPAVDDADAIGYGRVGLPCDQVRDEIAQSEEAQLWRASHATPTPSPPAQPAQVAPPPFPPPAGAPPPSVADNVTGVLAGLGVEIRRVTDSIGAIRDSVQAQIDQRIAATAPSVERAVKSVSDQLGGVVAGLVPNTLSLVGAALGGVETIAASFLAAAADVSDVAAAFVGAVSSQRDGLRDFGASVAGTIGHRLVETVAGQIADGTLTGSDVFAVAHSLVSEMTRAARAAAERGPRQA